VKLNEIIERGFDPKFGETCVLIERGFDPRLRALKLWSRLLEPQSSSVVMEAYFRAIEAHHDAIKTTLDPHGA
jgi:hypothetical protein